MKKIIKLRYYNVYIALLILYLIAVIYNIYSPKNSSLENILEIAMGVAVSIPFYRIYKITQEKSLKYYWLFVFVGVATFTVGDSLWLFADYVSKDYLRSITLSENIFLVANISLLAASFILLKSNIEIKKLNRKTSIDIFFILVLYFLLAVRSFKIFGIGDIETVSQLYSVVYIAIDIITLINLSILYIVVNHNMPDKIILYHFLGISLYTFSDIIYAYELTKSEYVTTSIINSFWMISFMIMSLAALEKINRIYNDSEFKISNSATYLSVIPVIVLLTVDIGEKYQAMIGIITTIVVLKQIKILNENKILVKRYKEINNTLETTVFERTIELSKKNIELESLLNKDALTNLYNRRYLIKKIDELIDDNDVENFGIMFIDLDNFKNINDLYGHDIGDAVLKEVSKRLNKYSSDNTYVFRQGGDEFIIICKEIKSEEDIIRKANIVINEFKKSEVIINDKSCEIELSIGGVVYPIHGKDRSTLMKKADMSMYTAKNENYSQIKIYKPDSEIALNIKMEELMKRALKNKEFNLRYQPQFNPINNKLVGVEALIRWNNEELGFVSPAKFIPLAERTGMIIDIGNWVLEEGFLQVKKWKEKYNTEIEIGINVSPIQLMDDNFLDILKERLSLIDIKPSQINLELTEDVAVKNSLENINKLKQIRQLGVKVSIDDFGSGYSSFEYLKNFAVDCLKLDMSLINNIDKSKEDFEIAKAIISLSKGLNLEVVAEGVETKSQLDTLRKLNCDIIQGYYYEKPIRSIEVEQKYLRQLISS